MLSRTFGETDVATDADSEIVIDCSTAETDAVAVVLPDSDGDPPN